jgi:hypothetical protein
MKGRRPRQARFVVGVVVIAKGPSATWKFVVRGQGRLTKHRAAATAFTSRERAEMFAAQVEILAGPEYRVVVLPAIVPGRWRC